MNTPEQLEKRVSLIAAKMTLQEPFIASIFTGLPREFPMGGTAGTNGKRLVFGVEYCSTLSDDELLFVGMHEGAHVIFMHMWRRDGRNPMLWNIACDAVINRMLVNKNYKMPTGGVLIDWVTNDMDAETVYKRLLNEQAEGGGSGQGDPDEDGEEQGQGSDSGQGDQQAHDNPIKPTGGGGWDGTGDLEDAPDDADSTDVEAKIQTAARMARACGDKSALIDRILGGELAPSVPWTETLRHVMTSASRDDYSYRRFNRRLLPQGIYMPSLWSESIGGLVIGVDTSGSVSERELDQMAGEINAIIEDCRPEWVEVVYCDAQVKRTERFQQGDPLKLHPLGGGGTRFKPVFDYADQMGEKIAALIYLTDLYGNTKECEAPEYPVVWAVTSNEKDVPFGMHVKVVI